MKISKPEQIENVWGVELGLIAVEFQVFASAAQLVARNAGAALDVMVEPARIQQVFATSLARAARAQGRRLVPVAVDDLQPVGNILQGPWDPVRMLQEPDFPPDLLPDFMEIAVVMGGGILKHTAELQDARPDIFTATS